MNDLKKSAVEFPHHSTRCIEGRSIPNFPCDRKGETPFHKATVPSYLQKYDPKSYWPSPECRCPSGFPDCKAMAGGAVPNRKIIATTEKLQELSQRNISDYLVKTRLDYKTRRLYGYEFQGQRGDYELHSERFHKAAEAFEEFLDNNTFLNHTYSTGLSWYGIMKDLNSLINNTATDKSVVVWWNNKAFHGLISATNALNNLLLRNNMPSTVSGVNKYGIVAYSHPWKMTTAQISMDIMNQMISDVIVALIVIFALGFIPASFVLFLIEERVLKSKHLQYVSGVNPNIYWFSTFVWDYTSYLISVILIILIFLAFQQQSYIGGTNFPCLLLLLLLFGFSITPLMYPFSYMFKVPSTAYVLLILANGFIGIITTITTYMLDMFTAELREINEVLKYIFLIFPQYCLGRGMFDMVLNYRIAQTVSDVGDYAPLSPFHMEVAGIFLICLAVQGVFFFAIIIGIEHHYVVRRAMVLRKRRKKELQMQQERRNTVSDFKDGDVYDLKSIETDVRDEQQKVLRGDYNKEPVVVRNLKKEYKTGKGKFTAVKNLTFHVPKTSCFGLLGINGAGKTTTFTILTGDVLPTAGQALIGGFDVVTHVNESRKKLGFCPQFDALDPFLSVEEHVQLYARLRGIEKKNVAFVTWSVIEKMGLVKYKERQAGTLSGGNKRKLSTAIALVGDPQIIFLDEPTAGMDPKARRLVFFSSLLCFSNLEFFGIQ